MRVFRTVAGVLVGVLGLAAAGAGGLAAFWLVGPDDVVSARTQTLTSKGVAIATEPDLIRYYDSRLVVTVEPMKSGTDLFVGVAHDTDLGSYLGHSANTRIVDYGYPSKVRTRDVAGSTESVVPPTQLDWWVAQVSGSGTRTLSWELSDGPYDLALMNADGHAGVQARATVGVEVKGAFRASLVTAAVGVLLLACSILLLVRGRSRGRRRRGDDDESSLLWEGRDAWDQNEFWNAGEQAPRGDTAPASSGGLLPLSETEEPDHSRATQDAEAQRPGAETRRQPVQESRPVGLVSAESRPEDGGPSAPWSWNGIPPGPVPGPPSENEGRAPHTTPSEAGRRAGAVPTRADHGQPSGPSAPAPHPGQASFTPGPSGRPPFDPSRSGPRPSDSRPSEPRTDDQGWTTQDPGRQERFGASPPGFDSASGLPWRPGGTGRRREPPADPRRTPSDQRGGTGRPGAGGQPGTDRPGTDSPRDQQQGYAPQRGHAQPGRAPQPGHAQPGRGQQGPGQQGPGQQGFGQPGRPDHGPQGSPDRPDRPGQPIRPVTSEPDGRSVESGQPSDSALYVGRRIARGRAGIGDEPPPAPEPADPRPGTEPADRDRRSAAPASDPTAPRESTEVALGADYDEPPAWLPGPVGPVLPSTKQQDGDTHG